MNDLPDLPIDEREERRLASYCPLCDERFASPRPSTLAERERKRLVHATCPACGMSVLFLTFPSDVGRSAVGIATELTAAEAAGPIRRVTVDHVIDVHQALAEGELERRLSLDKA